MIQREVDYIGYPMSRYSAIGEMSPEDKRKSVYGDKKQGDKLVKKKFSTPSYHATKSMKIAR